MTEATLYERLGGEAAITATVGMFYDRIMSDESLNPFFADLDMDKQINKQIAFMTMAFGGPHDYTGEDMRTAHARLLSRGLAVEHFQAVANHLQATLETLSVPSDLIEEVMRIVGSTKAEVLNE
ncbi:Group 1 truncated hemoglobin GlbN [Enhygromyxa salina]|uniref:Group 1 truncated hemoglobin n=1 Tax=Enhygromyxa salina TaxID=215803 RepID=A0A2S9YDR0_9BACT|nr:group 1 truncated hemoglobin [Enhygromyxa salina]PRQ03172.1 Group 1 truncated hemoglobin GlbN [Enhygromyxa salina]